MKLCNTLLVLAGMLALTSCDKNAKDPDDDGNYIIDWAPVSVYIEATDAEGNSIISPEMPGMTLTFKGETYSVRDWSTRYDEFTPRDCPTKEYLAFLYGLFAQPYDGGGVTLYRLNFGEIDGADDMDEDILLQWPDGSRDVIHYHCGNHRYGKNFGCDRSWKLNGEPHDGSLFTFTGKSLPPKDGE